MSDAKIIAARLLAIGCTRLYADIVVASMRSLDEWTGLIKSVATRSVEFFQRSFVGSMPESYWLGFIERNNLRGLACCAANYNNTDLVIFLCRSMNVPIFAIPLDERRHCGTDADVLGYRTPLSHAILGKHEELALALIELPNQELNCPETKTSALHLAAHAGMLSLARQLVQRHGLNFDTLDRHGYTPIVTVVALAHPPIVEFLLEQCRGRSRLEKVLEKACRGNGMPEVQEYGCVCIQI